MALQKTFARVKISHTQAAFHYDPDTAAAGRHLVGLPSSTQSLGTQCCNKSAAADSQIMILNSFLLVHAAG